MGIALITLKIMPTSLEASLEEIKEKSKDIIEKNEGKIGEFKEEPIAFGLKAVIVSFELDESKELEAIEEELKKIEEINSIQVVDMRRAFG